jgi:hypothetical protein
MMVHGEREESEDTFQYLQAPSFFYHKLAPNIRANYSP